MSQVIDGMLLNTTVLLVQIPTVSHVTQLNVSNAQLGSCSQVQILILVDLNSKTVELIKQINQLVSESTQTQVNMNALPV